MEEGKSKLMRKIAGGKTIIKFLIIVIMTTEYLTDTVISTLYLSSYSILTVDSEVILYYRSRLHLIDEETEVYYT